MLENVVIKPMMRSLLFEVEFRQIKFLIFTFGHISHMSSKKIFPFRYFTLSNDHFAFIWLKLCFYLSPFRKRKHIGQKDNMYKNVKPSGSYFGINLAENFVPYKYSFQFIGNRKNIALN